MLFPGAGRLRPPSDLTTDSCRKFNEQIADVPDVKYFSVSAVRPGHRVSRLLAIHAYKIIFEAEGENDGLVSVKSSTHWGTHLGVWPADHWHTINHRLVIEIKDPTGDITPYYLDVLDRMQASGMGATSSGGLD